MWKRWYGDSCPYCFWWLEQVLYTILYAFSRRFQCTKPHSIWWRTEGVMIEIVGVKSMQGGFQLKWVGNQWMDWAGFVVWCSYSIGNGVCQVTGQENWSPWTHIQNRVGKAKMGGMQVVVPWEPLMLELGCLRRLLTYIGEAHVPTHIIYGVKINILCPQHLAVWPMPMTALQHHDYNFQRLVGTAIVSLNIKEHTVQAISTLNKNWALGGGRR